MKEVFVSDIKESCHVDSVFLVKVKNLSVGKTGKPYLAVTFIDKSGELEARVWDDAERISKSFEADDFVRIDGRAVAYMGKLQLKLTGIQKVDESDINIADFLPAAKRDVDEMLSDLAKVAEGINDRYLRELIIALIDDPIIADNIKHAPAAKGMHHVYVGGLIEHVLSICTLVDLVCGHYGDGINRDLLIVGAIVHDIGKTKELSYKRAFGYTDEGRLLGHITIGVEMVDDKIRQIEGFPDELSMMVKHMILSHHGVYEYGSPKRPKTLEAMILNYLDDLDAKINSIQTLISNDNDNGSKWTGYHRLFERFIYKESFPQYDDLTDGGPCAVAEEQSDPADIPLQGKTTALFDK